MRDSSRTARSSVACACTRSDCRAATPRPTPTVTADALALRKPCSGPHTTRVLRSPDSRLDHHLPQAARTTYGRNPGRLRSKAKRVVLHELAHPLHTKK